MSTPYLSIICTGRNDNYGLHFDKRANAFLRHLRRYAQIYPGLFELIFVEWNPLPNAPGIADVLDFEGLDARVITVPAEYHKALPHSDRQPFFEYFAKNVGIRRARAPYILSTNPDILFSEKLFTYFANHKLQNNVLYRIDRYDFHPEQVYAAPAEAMLPLAIEQSFVVHVRWMDLQDQASFSVKGKPMAEWITSTRLPDEPLLEEGVFEANSRNTPHFGIHMNAGGDFALMHRKGWELVHGYAERPAYGSQLDGIMLAHICAKGFRHIVFTKPNIIFHMDHERHEQKPRPHPVYMDVHEEFARIFNEGEFNLSDDDWGMRDTDLPTREWKAA